MQQLRTRGLLRTIRALSPALLPAVWLGQVSEPRHPHLSIRIVIFPASRGCCGMRSVTPTELEQCLEGARTSRLGFWCPIYQCIEHLTCVGHWLAYEGCKEQSAMAPDTPLHDAHNKHRQGAVGGAGQVFQPSVRQGRSNGEGRWSVTGSLEDE